MSSQQSPPDPGPAPAPEQPLLSSAGNDERRARKAMWIRAGIYIAGLHLFAGFLGLLFLLGNRGR